MKVVAPRDLRHLKPYLAEPSATTLQAVPYEGRDDLYIFPIYFGPYGPAPGVRDALEGLREPRRVSDSSARHYLRYVVHLRFLVPAEGGGWWERERLERVWKLIADLGPHHGRHVACEELVRRHAHAPRGYAS